MVAFKHFSGSLCGSRGHERGRDIEKVVNTFCDKRRQITACMATVKQNTITHADAELLCMTLQNRLIHHLYVKSHTCAENFLKQHTHTEHKVINNAREKVITSRHPAFHVVESNGLHRHYVGYCLLTKVTHTRSIMYLLRFKRPSRRTLCPTRL